MNLFFLTQLVVAGLMCGSMFFKALETTQGVSLSLQIILELFVLLHLKLVQAAHKMAPSSITSEAIIIYRVYGTLTAVVIGVICLSDDYRWCRNDTNTMALAGISALAICSAAMIFSTPMTDPIPKSLLAIAFKALPQWMMAWKIGAEGGAGIPMVTIIAGNVSVLLRIWMIAKSIKDAGWERNRTWLLISETFNELSWATVSLVWWLR